MAKQGDIVRYLNAVGGGRIIRIEGNTAYVDDDGFETPIPVRECVVVRSAEEAARTEPDKPTQTTAVQPAAAQTTVSASQKEATVAPAPAVDMTDEPDTDEETPYGDKLNVVLGFEAIDLRHISSTNYEASLVNDSNYFLYFTFLTAEAESPESWTTRYAGIVEPNIQVLLGTFSGEEVGKFERMAVQYIAFKCKKTFEPKMPGNVSFKVDTTKFFKLHCFRDNEYFDNPVLAFSIVHDDKPFDPVKTEAVRNALVQEMQRKRANDRKPVNRRTQPVKTAQDINTPLVIDLHINQLIDNTHGLSAGDMLNLQIDKFREVMNANRRLIGKKIIFIHGKGEGVLRQALMKELTHLYKGHDVQDASFREYGYGATQVTIRNIKK
ncbi:MAG: DUF2027 domain-containing protein [Bacteroidales bacterium]|nr:DUF2027 domain-containing protein [Bacteroidales bacterium]